MCSFRSLKQARSQDGRAYDVGVTKGEHKIQGDSTEDKTPVTNLIKHPGYWHKRTILIKTYDGWILFFQIQKLGHHSLYCLFQSV